jgi:hypothetical protein
MRRTSHQPLPYTWQGLRRVTFEEDDEEVREISRQEFRELFPDEPEPAWPAPEGAPVPDDQLVVPHSNPGIHAPVACDTRWEDSATWLKDRKETSHRESCTQEWITPQFDLLGSKEAHYGEVITDSFVTNA